MDEKLKAKWVKALRSGKYKQAKDYLKTEIEVFDDESGETSRNEIGYCCLGVLCEIAPGIKWSGNHYVITQKKLAKVFPDQKDEEIENYDWERSGDQVVITGEALPAPLYKHFGMDKTVTYHGDRLDVHSKLTRMNDQGESFEKIADYIEKVL
jgi:hypothetical protein